MLLQKITGTFIIVMKVKGSAGILKPLFAVCQHRSGRDFMTLLAAIKLLGSHIYDPIELRKSKTRFEKLIHSFYDDFVFEELEVITRRHFIRYE